MNSIDIEDAIRLSFLPNPARNEIQLIIRNVPSDASFHIEIINLFGEIVLSKECGTSYFIDTSSLQNGFYQLLLFIAYQDILIK